MLRASLAQCGLARNSLVYRGLAKTGAKSSRASIIFSYQSAAASISEQSSGTRPDPKSALARHFPEECESMTRF